MVSTIALVKASFPNLDLSHITIDTEGQTPTRLVESKGTEDLFADDINLDPQGDGEAINHEKSVEDSTRQPKDVQVVKDKNEETPSVQQLFFFFFLDLLEEQYLCLIYLLLIALTCRHFPL